MNFRYTMDPYGQSAQPRNPYQTNQINLTPQQIQHIQRQRAQMMHQHQSQQHPRQLYDPRFQHTAHMHVRDDPRWTPAQRMQIEQRQQQLAMQAQKEQVKLLNKNREPDHVFYYDPSIPQCENSYKIVRSFPNVVIMDVTRIDPRLINNVVPECVTHLPAIMRLGKIVFKQGSLCEQYIKNVFRVKRQTSQMRFLDTSKPVGNMFPIEPTEAVSQRAIEIVDQQGLNKVYQNFPNFGSNWDEAMRRSEEFIKRAEATLKYKGVKVPEPINESKNYKDPGLMSRVDAEVHRREQILAKPRPSGQPQQQLMP